MKGTVWQKGNEPSHEGPSQALGVELALFVQQLLEGFFSCPYCRPAIMRPRNTGTTQVLPNGPAIRKEAYVNRPFLARRR